MEKTNRPVGRPRGIQSKDYRIMIRIEPDVEKAFLASCKKNRRTQKDEINFILKDYYIKNLELI